jgi:hypothetical protein
LLPHAIAHSAIEQSIHTLPARFSAMPSPLKQTQPGRDHAMNFLPHATVVFVLHARTSLCIQADLLIRTLYEISTLEESDVPAQLLAGVAAAKAAQATS